MPSAAAQLPLRKESPGTSRPIGWSDSDPIVTSQPLKDCCDQTTLPELSMEVSWDSFQHSLKSDDPSVTQDSCTNSNVAFIPDKSTTYPIDEDFSGLFKDPFFGLSSDESDCLRAVNPLDVHAFDNLDDPQQAVDDGQNDALAGFDLVDFVVNDEKEFRLPAFENLINEPRLFDEVERDPDASQVGIAEPELNLNEEPFPNIEETAQEVSEALPGPSSSSPSLKRGRPPRVVAYPTTPDIPRRGRPSSSSPAAKRARLLTDSEKYRHIRDLNNEASRRCRQKRKQKAEDKIREYDIEMEKNGSLKVQVHELQDQVDRVTSAVLKIISPTDLQLLREKFLK